MTRLLFIIVLFNVSQVIYSQDIFELVDQANEYYINNEYELAIEKYQAVLDSDYESAQLHYNLGNAYFKSHKLTMALVCYERAYLLDPTDEEISHNLNMARKYVVDEIDVLPELQLKIWFKRFAGILSSDSWAHFSISAFILALLLLLFYLFSKRLMIRKITFWIAVFSLFISISCYTLAYQQKKLVYDHNFAIISSPSVTIKSSPDESGTELFQLHEGTKVVIIDQLGDWREIKLSDGNVGWLRLDNIIML